MRRLFTSRRWGTIAAGLWAIVFLYFFILILFFRVVYANGLYWYNVDPPLTIPPWYYIPEYLILYSPMVIVGFAPIMLLYRPNRREPNQHWPVPHW